MGQFIALNGADGFSIPTYVSRPDGTPKAAIVVLQEIFGVNDHIQQVVDRFAFEGYLALAPAMFERVQPGVNFGYSAAEVEKGIALKADAMALPDNTALKDIQVAVDWAAGQGGLRIGVVGYCWGGLLSWQAACELHGLSAAVPYYGGGMVSDQEIARRPRVPVLAHLSDHDKTVPMEGIENLRKAHPQVEIHLYSADHGFNCDQRGAYNAEAAKLSGERTLAFFSRHLAG